MARVAYPKIKYLARKQKFVVTLAGCVIATVDSMARAEQTVAIIKEEQAKAGVS